jgi:hypothetical protein
VRRGGPPVLRRLLLALGVSLALLLLLEGGARLWLRWTSQPYDGARDRGRVLEIQSRAQDPLPLPARRPDRSGRHPGSRESLHPYLGFESTNGPPAFANELRTSRDAAARAASWRVLLLGGSVAAIFERLGREHLARLLAADPNLRGREVQMGSLARPAFKQPQPYLYLCWALSLGVRPDAVLLIDGFNEVSLGRANAIAGMHPGFPAWSQWMAVARPAGSSEELIELWIELRQRKRELVRATELALGWPCFESALVGRLALRWVRSRESRWSEANASYLEQLAGGRIPPSLLGPPFEGTPEEALHEVAASWMECSRLIEALCSSLGIAYLHVLQPTLFDPGSKPASAEELAILSNPPGWVVGVEQGYPALRRLGERLVKEGIAFLDASRLFADVAETLYYDECHFGEEGNRRLAEAIGPALLEALAKRQ